MIKIYEAKDNIYYWNGKDEVPKDVVNVVIEDGVTEIGKYSFNGCESLQSIKIPDSVTEIGEAAFANCYSLQSIKIPDSVTEIGGSIFWICKTLQSVKLSNNIKELTEQTFYSCKSLKSIVIPNSVTKIGRGAFEVCDSLQSIKIPDSVTSIDYGAFYGCKSLKSIVIPNSVTKIGGEVFGACISLKSIVIPSSVEYIGDDAFYYCTSLTNVDIQGDPKIGKTIFRSTPLDNSNKDNNVSKKSTKNTVVAKGYDEVVDSDVWGELFIYSTQFDRVYNNVLNVFGLTEDDLDEGVNGDFGAYNGQGGYDANSICANAEDLDFDGGIIVPELGLDIGFCASAVDEDDVEIKRYPFIAYKTASKDVLAKLRQAIKGTSFKLLKL